MREIDLEMVSAARIFVLAEDYAGSEGSYYAQHGISFLIRVKETAHKSWSILFDTGTDASPILHNAAIIGVDLDDIETILLSHCHYDHTGGLIEILGKIEKGRLPVVGHPQLFRDNLLVDPYIKQAGVSGDLKRKAGELGAMWTLTKDPLKLAQGVVTTGEIPVEERAEDEKTGTSNFYTVKNGQLVEDDMLDDTSLMMLTKKGLVVVTGCAHAGIVSIVKRCKEMSQMDRVQAVIGGFHLINADSNRINRTIKDLKKLSVENIYTGHCTGLKAEGMLQKEFGDSFNKLQCGKIIEL